MNLNLTNLKDLEYICQLAAEHFEPPYGLPKETEWLSRISRYRQLFQTEIDRGACINLEPNYFGELIAILHFEDLLRLQRRAQIANNPRLAEILGEQIAERQAIETEQRDP